MYTLKVNKKLLTIIGGMVLIILGGLFLNYLQKKQANKPKPLEIQTSQIDKAVIPAGLPQNLPSIAGSKTLQNYESKTNDGRLQSTREMSIPEEADKVLKVYMDFFESIGFKGSVVKPQETSENSQKLAQMKKGSDVLMLVVTPQNKLQSTIELTLTQTIK